MSAYELSDVEYRVDGARILSSVSESVEYGEVLALVGPNGAGKSTLLGVLAGDVAPTAGRVSCDGVPVSEWSVRELSRKRSVLLQSSSLAFPFTIRQVIDMGRAPWLGVTSAAEDDRARARAIAWTDTAELLDRPFPSLSGGEKARVMLARVLAQNTSIVLLDEPTAALDIRHQEAVLQTTRRLAAEGVAVVIVLHDLSLAAAYADRVTVLRDGAVVVSGTPHGVLTAPILEDVYDTPVHVLTDPGTGRPLIVPQRTPLPGRSGDAGWRPTE